MAAGGMPAGAALDTAFDVSDLAGLAAGGGNDEDLAGAIGGGGEIGDGTAIAGAAGDAEDIAVGETANAEAAGWSGKTGGIAGEGGGDVDRGGDIDDEQRVAEGAVGLLDAAGEGAHAAVFADPGVTGGHDDVAGPGIAFGHDGDENGEPHATAGSGGMGD